MMLASNDNGAPREGVRVLPIVGRLQPDGDLAIDLAWLHTLETVAPSPAGSIPAAPPARHLDLSPPDGAIR